jgi:SAM-dependent methyltransferase
LQVRLGARALARKLRAKLIGPPAPGMVRWGHLRRLAPLDAEFGYSRGTPIDRFYIERFLHGCSQDIAGEVLEVKDAHYTRRFGRERVVGSHVLDIDPNNTSATLIVDLNAASQLPSNAYQCIILTQVLQYVFNLESALSDLHRSLRPGGVLLLTVPGITPVRTRNSSWYWSFTELALARLLEKQSWSALSLSTHGNILAATALLYGISQREITQTELDFPDPDYPVMITARAVKSAG